MRVRSQSSRRTVPTQRSAYAFATGVRGGVRMIVVPSLRKTSSNAPDELAGAVADQERDRAAVTHHEVAGGLRGPVFGRVGGDAGEVQRRRSSSMKNST